MDDLQCQMITKAGKRCSRNSVPAGRFCWQHVPLAQGRKGSPWKERSRSDPKPFGTLCANSYVRYAYNVTGCVGLLAIFIGVIWNPNLGLILFGIQFVLALVSVTLLSWDELSRNSERRERAAAIILRLRSNDRRVPLYSLYLRPFSLTGKVQLVDPSFYYELPIGADPPLVNLERVLARALEPSLPLLGLGQGYGIDEITSGDDSWKSDFKLLTSKAMPIFVVPSDHKGTMWETQWLKQAGLLNRCIFIMPPTQRSLVLKKPYIDVDLHHAWERAAANCATFGLKLPQYDEDGLLLQFGNDGNVYSMAKTDFTSEGIVSAIRRLWPGSLVGLCVGAAWADTHHRLSVLYREELEYLEARGRKRKRARE